MAENPHITLRELQRRVKSVLEGSFALPLWVSAEISDIKVNYSGHCYLELVEKGGANGVPTAQARAVIWKSHFPRIAAYFEAETGQRLAPGLKILAKVLVSYHELYGFSLQITDVDPSFTLGDLERQRQQTIAQLQQDGVWEMNRGVPMPTVVQRVAVVSSAQAAGYQDFCKELAKSPYRFEVELFDAFMQGEAAEGSIIDALCRVADRLEEFDAVVIIRGGGSRSDLNCFNAYRICSYVAQFPLPVITGIGHDKDTSVADMVAHTALKTPTAVAGWLVERMDRICGWLDAAALQLHDGVLRLSRTQQVRLEELAGDVRHLSLGLLRQRGLELGSREEVFRQAVGRCCRVGSHHMEAAALPPVSHRDTRRRGDRHRRRDSGDFLTGNARSIQGLGFLPAAAKYKGVSAFETADRFALPGQIDQEGVDFRLGHTVMSAALAGRDFFRVRTGHL